MKRFTIELPVPLYKRLKLHAFVTEKPMADVVRELLDRMLLDGTTPEGAELDQLRSRIARIIPGGIS